MFSNATLLSLCNSFAGIIDAALGVVNQVLTAAGLGSLTNSIPTAASICTSLFGS